MELFLEKFFSDNMIDHFVHISHDVVPWDFNPPDVMPGYQSAVAPLSISRRRGGVRSV
jgi:hypothetical protein